MEREQYPHHGAISRRQLVRRGAGLLVASLGIPLLAACGGGTTATTTAVDSTAAKASTSSSVATATSTTTAIISTAKTVVTASATAPAAAAANGQTLQMWIIGGKVQADVLTGKVLPGLYQTAAGIKEIQITSLGDWQDLFTKLVTALAGNTGPDLARIKDYWSPEFAVRGVLLPLDAYLGKQQDITSEKYGTARWDSAHWKGKTYSLPFTTFVEDYFVNDTLLKEAGLQPAQTWDEQVTNAQKLTDPAKQQWGYMLYDYGASQSGTWDFIPLLWQAGGAFTNTDRSKLAFNSDAGITALTYQTDLIWKYKVCLPPGISTNKVVENDKIGQWHNGCWVTAAYPTSAPTLKYSTHLLPALKADNRSVIIGGNNVGGFKGTKYADQVWQTLAWIGSEQSDLTWNSTTGYLPVRTANWQKPPYSTDPNWKVVIEQAQRKDTQPIPIFVGYEEVTDKIGAELQAAYQNKKTPKQALADAELEGTQLLLKYSQG
ncbi:MAG TPA: extracellular solute-binding protein [Chloroflexota bacterium]|jgi:multiple sugar transport system substrate-binding protein